MVRVLGRWGPSSRSLEAGHARPLLAERYPVPVQLGGRWWHLPDPDSADSAGDFVPATESDAACYEQLAGRLRAADAAIGHTRHDEVP